MSRHRRRRAHKRRNAARSPAVRLRLRIAATTARIVERGLTPGTIRAMRWLRDQVDLGRAIETRGDDGAPVFVFHHEATTVVGKLGLHRP